MKKTNRIAMSVCSALMITLTSLVSLISNAVESDQRVDYGLWDKFLKYDLCITDYNALTDKEKELCRFIFETEQGTDETIICERARRTLAHDENIGERITPEQLEDCYGIWDNYSYSKYGSQTYIHCVPDIKYLDGWYDYNEYWLDDEGTSYVRFTGENSGKLWDKFYVYGEENYAIPVKPSNEPRFDTYIKDDNEYYCSDGYVQYNGDYYTITPENTAVLVKSQYSMTYLRNTDNPVTEKIVIPDEVNGCPVTAIGYDAFGYALVTEVVLPDTVEFIDSFAFSGCIYLESINFPEHLKFIGYEAFSGCAFDKLEFNYPDITISPYAFGWCNELTDVTVNAKKIDEGAFFNCVSLKNVTLDEDVEKVCAEAFQGCQSIEDISLPSSLKAIGTEAFSGYYSYTTGVKSITIPPTVEIIGALPRQRGEGATSGIHVPPTHPLTDEQECVFDSDCVIYGYRGTEAERYAKEWDLEFVELEAQVGDVNLDGTINVADAVALQRYLLGQYVGTGAAYGDLNGDGKVDVFDMILMRQRLIN